MVEAPFTSYYTNSYSSMSKTNFPITSPTEEKLTTLLVTGISTPLLVIVLAVVIITIIAMVWINLPNTTKTQNSKMDCMEHLQDKNNWMLLQTIPQMSYVQFLMKVKP